MLYVTLKPASVLSNFLEFDLKRGQVIDLDIFFVARDQYFIIADAEFLNLN